MSCPAVRCGTVPCCAVLLPALLCFFFRTYQTTTLARRLSWREPAYPRAFYTAPLSRLFPLFFLGGGVMLYQYSNSSSSMSIRTSMLLSIKTASTAQHSTAKHSTAQSPLHKAANQVRTCQSEYVFKEVYTYTHATSRLFCWSMELLAFASRVLVPKILDHRQHLSFQSILAFGRA